MSSRHLALGFMVVCACGSEKAPPPSAGPVSGQIGGQSFAAHSARADWTNDGEFLSIAFVNGEMTPCAEPRSPVKDGRVEFDISVLRSNALPGKKGTYEFRAQGPSEIHVTAGATRFVADGQGGATQNVTVASTGQVTITGVTAERIDGTVTAEEPRTGLSVRGSFAVAICPEQKR